MTPSFIRVTVALVVCGSVVLLGVVRASAATLGGLRTSDLGSSSASVAVHTNGITAQWLAARSGSSWVLKGITLRTTGADRFSSGERIKVGLVASNGSAICEVSVIHSGVTSSQAISRAMLNTACGSAGVNFTSISRVSVQTGS